MTFKRDDKFNSSFKMGEAKVPYINTIANFGSGDTSNCDGKVPNLWSGSFKARNGTVMRASFWNWNGGLIIGEGVSVWVSNPKYLTEFIKFLES